jgi:cobalt transporter subunit CbtB
MLQTLTVVRPHSWVPMGLVLLSLFAWYTLALDQGWLLSWFQGAQAFDLNVIHELVHDTRHAAGFPCH